MRQIILDTETTGMPVEEGHRIIEIGCLEMIDRKLTGKEFHYYLNPEREVEAGALAVHGINNEFLKNKPIFSVIVESFLEFISGSELIMHNAPFDTSFINEELNRIGGYKSLVHYCRITDTLPMARQLHVGQRNSLDALCKRYGVDRSKRQYHGALLDAYLLAQVYLMMTGGQGSFFDSLAEQTTANDRIMKPLQSSQKHCLVVLKAQSEELSEHLNYLQRMKNQNKCLWLEESEVNI